MFNRKGQKIESPTVHVAIFVIVMALFIVLYLIVLPTSEREKILGEDSDYYSGDDVDEDSEVEGEIILSETPGVVYPYSKDVEEKDLASVSLYSTTQTSPIMLADTVIITKSLFRNGFKEFIFDIDDLSDLEGLGLFFNTGEATGDLIVEINGQEVYKGRVKGGDLPLELPGAFLKKYNNRLVFEVTSPTWKFLSVNKFILRDLQLIKQINLVNKVEMRSFVVDKLDSMRKGEIGFFINCLKINTEQGTLKIGLNGRSVYVGKVVCDAGHIEIDLLKNYFVEDRNTLTFEIDKGEYVLEQVSLGLDVEDKKMPQYYFAIDEKEGTYKLKLNFEVSDEIKRGTITINGDNIYLDEYRNLYRKDITNMIREGENYIKINAKNEFVVDLLEIVQE